MKAHTVKFSGMIFFALFLMLAAACHRIDSGHPDTSHTVSTSAVTLMPATVVIHKTASGKAPQFVVLAFDGSRSLPMWQATLDFAKNQTEKGAPVHFTYFLSGVYFLDYFDSNKYSPPNHPEGSSLIGFADTAQDIAKRVTFVNRAIAEGHEIGSHVNGHFDGSKWSEKDWQQEFSEFNKLIFSIPENNNVPLNEAANYKLDISSKDIVGFRAPDLGRNPALYKVLKANGFLYDTSSVAAKASDWPTKQNGIWEFPLARIPYATSSTYSLLSMDYNFYFKQSGAKDAAKKGDAKWNQFYQDTYTSYINYFNSNYGGTRSPVFIGSHFSQWNDGVYWEAVRDFASSVCGKPETYCVSFKELMQYLNSHPQTK